MWLATISELSFIHLWCGAHLHTVTVHGYGTAVSRLGASKTRQLIIVSSWLSQSPLLPAFRHFPHHRRGHLRRSRHRLYVCCTNFGESMAHFLGRYPRERSCSSSFSITRPVSVRLLRNAVSSGVLRCLPPRRHTVGHSPTLLDIHPGSLTSLASLAPDDHIRSLKSRSIWLHGRSRWSITP